MMIAPPYSDEEILNAIRKKGAIGWELFCARFDPMIKSITRWPKWRFSEHEQQDVQQNIYVQLQTALPTFRQRSSLTRFVKIIAMRQCVNEIRQQVRWRGTIISLIQKTPNGEWNEMEFANQKELNPYHEVLKKERLQALAAAMQKLNDTCRTSITLFYVQDLSYQEMAERLNIKINTVGSRLAKCLEKLHKELRQQHLFERIST